jgi:DNA-binding CsgD family transcriptional regulator
VTRIGTEAHTASVWQQRAEHTRRDIAALASAGLAAGRLHAAAIELIGEHVPADLTCWATLDPQTLAISGMTSGTDRAPPEYDPLLAHAEYAPDEPHTFAGLARNRQALARLADLPTRDRARSARLNTVWRPLGLTEELRFLFLTGDDCWGAAGIVRSRCAFTDDEAQFLLAVAPTIAAATRLTVRTQSASTSAAVQPAIVVIGASGRPHTATAAARDWQDRLDDDDPGRFQWLMHVMAAGARATAPAVFQTRVTDPHGQWITLNASQLIGGDDTQIAVVIEPASGHQLLGLMLTAYGLTPRERAICHQVIDGHPTTLIARHLGISVHTVQDHLKSIFDKTTARSRGELVARLHPEPTSPH